jgi:hypothetical protein
LTCKKDGVRVRMEKNNIDFTIIICTESAWNLELELMSKVEFQMRQSDLGFKDWEPIEMKFSSIHINY